MKAGKFFGVFALILVVLSSVPAHALSKESKAQFRAVMDMSLEELGQKSAVLLRDRFPDADWNSYNIPGYAYSDQATEIAYKVAVKNQSLLGIANVSDEDVIIPCYCTCDSFGHENLLYCFYKNGDPDKGFDEHGSHVPYVFARHYWPSCGMT